MKSMVGLAALAAVLAGAGASAVPGSPAARQGDDWCGRQQWGDDRAGVCEVRTFTVAATGGTLSVEGTNGGIEVEGQARNDVQVLAKVVASGRSEARAREIAAAVRVEASMERVHSEGPRSTADGEGWSVSYRVYAPRGVNLSLRTTNGGIAVREMEAGVEFATTNGGVKLHGLAGTVKGRTTNGGVEVDLDGPSWNGEGLDVQTTNGGVRLAVPEQYSAQLEVSTNNGGINVDFPGAPSDRRRRNVSLQLGSGGAPIRLRTSNGGVHVTRK